MATVPKVTFGLYNLEINSDSTPSVDDIQSFSKIDDLRTGNVVDYPLATFEPDYWSLSGEYKFRVENEAAVHVGWISQSMCSDDGSFGTPPVLTVNFGGVHSSDGLVLRFSQATGDWPTSVQVVYRDLLGNVISNENYSPDAWEYEIDNVVENFNSIEITFDMMNKPYRYLRVSGIDYGQLISFTGTAVKNASVTEQINQLAVEVPANTCEVGLYSDDATFSIVNPTGYYSRLTQRQPLSIYELVDGAQKFIGRYYLDTWKNTSDTIIGFSCVDAVGLLGRIPYNGGMWLPGGIPLEYLIDEVMHVAAIPYDLDPDLFGISVIGWIPRCTCREALQQIAFAVGAYIDCSRSNIVKIKKMNLLTGTETVVPITNAQKGSNQSLEMRTLVTGVEITAHDFAESAEAVELFSGTLAVGTYEVEFSEPAHAITASGADILESGVNRTKIRVLTAGPVVVSGKKYTDSKRTFSQYNTTLGSYVIENVVKITTATLVSSTNGAAVVARVYGYYQQRYKHLLRLYSPAVENGDVVLIDSLNASQIRAVVERMEINLSGGFIADVTAVGVVE